MTNGLDIPPSKWKSYDDRIVAPTMELLELLKAYNVTGTFFVLGCVAERHPGLIEEIARNGHEIGSHGGWHRLIPTLTMEAFREDVRYSKQMIKQATGRDVRLYRAPSWSISPGTYEALAILHEEGFICDSSMQPFRTPLSGASGTPDEPFLPAFGDQVIGLTEYPPTIARVASMPFPFSGGFYLRALPYFAIRRALRSVNRKRPGMIYVHPWELDPAQPRVKTSALIKIIQYYGLNGTKVKLEQLLRDFRFTTLGELLSAGNSAYPVHSLGARRLSGGL